MSSHPRPWHQGSKFGAGPRRPLNREQRAKFNFLLNAHRSVCRISPTYRDVGKALLKHLGSDGRCDASQDTLARDAGCCARTVRRAIRRLREIGLLWWQHRLARYGERTVQTSNAYLLLLPAGPVLPRVRAEIVSGGQSVRGTLPSELSSLRMAGAGPELTLDQEQQRADQSRQRQLQLLTGGLIGSKALMKGR